jgi:hypothetical protein
MSNLVVHCKRDRFDVYIGRSRFGLGEYGNPFSHKAGTKAQFRVATREEALAAYEKWLLGQPELVAKVKRELRGKVLGCWCAGPSGFGGNLMCHGQLLAALANGVHWSEVAK